ncbi:symmetrical bis(5'-nucleosyl)-tetraphosphatase [Porticoccus sp.]|uniref:symmetrical bis(5'-nucleosyl)-tetraphosphatase n=1 Tax=Porticoccus sp. TaxID=2024853 RepID=UPI003F69B234
MTIYAVGDLQGCLKPLQQLLKKVHFEPGKDCLWSVGDIVNRGPDSLDTLRFCHQLGTSFQMVLGNHDLHLLAIAHGVRAPNQNDTLEPILKAPDRDQLLNWLQLQPLVIAKDNWLMVHAGIPPQWSRDEALTLASEIGRVLRQPEQASAFFQAMYGDQPDQWNDRLSGQIRWRLITNYFTRMRFCSASGQLELRSKLPPNEPPPGYAPWYSHPHRRARQSKIIFGHWAAMQGQPCGSNLFPMDTGCVWGGPMRLMNLDTGDCLHQRL